MKINLLIPIEVSEDGKHCGGCGFLNSSKYCWLFAEENKRDICNRRLPACLAAERKGREKQTDDVFVKRQKAKALLGIPPRVPKEPA